MIATKTRQTVRERANFACEYCGVTETDSGGELTIDHFQPQSKNGSDKLENLVYACQRCNMYKSDYFPATELSRKLWNPRQELSDNHFLLLPTGELYALSEIGKFTITRLRLNRIHLINYRRKKQAKAEESFVLESYQSLVKFLLQINEKQLRLLAEQSELLNEQSELLKDFKN
jgi:hypothetical protein